jgi:integrase
MGKDPSLAPQTAAAPTRRPTTSQRSQGARRHFVDSPQRRTLAVEAFKNQIRISGTGPFLFPSDKNPSGHHKTLKTAWQKTLKRAGIPYFRIYDLRSTYATRLSAGGVADEWVTQLLRQGDAKVFKKYSQMKLQMKREALEKMNRLANEMALDSGTAVAQ